MSEKIIKPPPVPGPKAPMGDKLQPDKPAQKPTQKSVQTAPLLTPEDVADEPAVVPSTVRTDAGSIGSIGAREGVDPTLWEQVKGMGRATGRGLASIRGAVGDAVNPVRRALGKRDLGVGGGRRLQAAPPPRLIRKRATSFDGTRFGK